MLTLLPRPLPPAPSTMRRESGQHPDLITRIPLCRVRDALPVRRETHFIVKNIVQRPFVAHQLAYRPHLSAGQLIRTEEHFILVWPKEEDRAAVSRKRHIVREPFAQY